MRNSRLDIKVMANDILINLDTSDLQAVKQDPKTPIEVYIQERLVLRFFCEESQQEAEGPPYHYPEPTIFSIRPEEMPGTFQAPEIMEAIYEAHIN